MRWTRSNPVYPVADVATSIDWYSRVLGFEPRIVNPPGDDIPVYAVPYHGDVSIHLLRKDEGALWPNQSRADSVLGRWRTGRIVSTSRSYGCNGAAIAR